MNLAAGVLEMVRQRGKFACEYCGVSETDSGGLLTVDHYQPRSHDGTDELENLVYSCFRCNNYKGDYWPTKPADSFLWNPRQEPAERHVLILDDGSLHPLSPVGSLAITLLQLNRPQLVAHRLDRRRKLQTETRKARLVEMLAILQEIRRDRAQLTREQFAILEEQRRLLEMFLSLLDE